MKVQDWKRDLQIKKRVKDVEETSKNKCTVQLEP